MTDMATALGVSEATVIVNIAKIAGRPEAEILALYQTPEQPCEVCGEPATELVNDLIDASSLRSEFFDPDDLHSRHYFCGAHGRPFRLYSLDRTEYIEGGVKHQVVDEAGNVAQL